MTIKQLAHALRRGLGCAIIELQTHPDKEQYHKIVLLYCMRDISHDWQCEGTKGYYLYTAICALEAKQTFEPLLIKRFLSQCPDMLFLQLCDILVQYADDGSDLSKNALRQKYHYFSSKKGKLSKCARWDEGFQWNEVTNKLFQIDGFVAFKQYAADAGKILAQNQNNRTLYYDWFIARANDTFGKKRVQAFIEKEAKKSSAIRALVDTLKADETAREEYRARQVVEKVTVELAYHTALQSMYDEYPQSKMLRTTRLFVKNATKTEITDLAQLALKEENETVKALLLLPFRRKPFPLAVEPLLQFIESKNEHLAEISADCLGQIKNNKIHDYALLALESKGIKPLGLKLFIKNYRKSDDQMISAQIKKSKNVPHHVQRDLRTIYLEHRSKDALPALLHVYKNGACTLCRYGIVQAMHHCGVLPDEILYECLFDSYDDTRKLAKRIIARRKRDSGHLSLR